MEGLNGVTTNGNYNIEEDLGNFGSKVSLESPLRLQTIEVEVVQKDRSNFSKRRLENEVDSFIRKREYISRHLKIEEFPADSELSKHVESVTVCHEEEGGTRTGIHLPSAKMIYRIFKLNRMGAEVEEINNQEGDEEVPAAQNWTLPAAEFQGVWENLVYDSHIKKELLRFVETSLLLADRKVDTNIVGCNRVVLLHGPPGTGKTSLCKALSHKLSIRLADRYSSGQLVEINSHSLFSKWFSESGKLVQKMFTEIKRLMENPRSLVCVLIDEVESLTAARKASGSEPSDAIRVVNALLTQLDSIKSAPNVLILTTSNITGAIDLAFVDRADIKQYIGPPSQGAIYQILYSCIAELTRTGVVSAEESLLTLRELNLTNFTPGAASKLSLELWATAKVCQEGGMSGRALRKAPFLALALFCAQDTTPSTHHFVNSLNMAIKKQLQDQKELTKT